MQMLDAYVTIANGGVTRPPHLLDATVDANGNRHAAPVLPGRRVVSASTADEMSSMLEGVVSSGTGACAAIPGYTVAGKTGTARKAVNGGYSNGTMASFIGYAPAAHPKLAAIVVLDEPSNTYGGTAAAPVFADVMQFALTHYGVAPDDVANTQLNAARASARESGTDVRRPRGRGGDIGPHGRRLPRRRPRRSNGRGLRRPGVRRSSTRGRRSRARRRDGSKHGRHGELGCEARPETGRAVAERARPGTGGAPATPGSLPDDTSKSG